MFCAQVLCRYGLQDCCDHLPHLKLGTGFPRGAHMALPCSPSPVQVTPEYNRIVVQSGLFSCELRVAGCVWDLACTLSNKSCPTQASTAACCSAAVLLVHSPLCAACRWTFIASSGMPRSWASTLSVAR